MPLNMKANATLLTLLVLIPVFFSGCATPVAIDPMTGQEQLAEFRAGYFYAPIEADARTIFKATIRELDDMGYFRTGELHKETSITVYARKIGDEPVQVLIEQMDAGLSRLRIRVGKFGNLAESQLIYSKIRGAI